MPPSPSPSPSRSSASTGAILARSPARRDGRAIGPRYAADVAEFEPATAATIRATLAIDPDDVVATLIAPFDSVPVGHAALRRLGRKWS